MTHCLVASWPQNGRLPKEACRRQRNSFEPHETLTLKKDALEAENAGHAKDHQPRGDLARFLSSTCLSIASKPIFDLGPDGIRTGKSLRKEPHFGCCVYRIGERLSTGELLGICDHHFSTMEEYPYSPMSLKMRMEENVLFAEQESIHYHDLYAPGKQLEAPESSSCVSSMHWPRASCN